MRVAKSTSFPPKNRSSRNWQATLISKCGCKDRPIFKRSRPANSPSWRFVKKSRRPMAEPTARISVGCGEIIRNFFVAAASAANKRRHDTFSPRNEGYTPSTRTRDRSTAASSTGAFLFYFVIATPKAISISQRDCFIIARMTTKRKTFSSQKIFQVAPFFSYNFINPSNVVFIHTLEQLWLLVF